MKKGRPKSNYQKIAELKAKTGWKNEAIAYELKVSTSTVTRALRWAKRGGT